MPQTENVIGQKMRRTVQFLIFTGILLVIAAAAITHTNGPITDPIPRLILML